MILEHKKIKSARKLTQSKFVHRVEGVLLILYPQIFKKCEVKEVTFELDLEEWLNFENRKIGVMR